MLQSSTSLNAEHAGSKYHLGSDRKVTRIQHGNTDFASCPSAHERLGELFQQGQEEGYKCKYLYIYIMHIQ